MHTIPFLQQKVNQAFTDISLAREPLALYEPIRYALGLGGKRVRPLLVLMAVDLFDGDIDGAIPLAIGLEIFHNFTLVHDDMMDNAPLRRGKESVYLKYGNNAALLAGDTMFALANSYMAQANVPALPQILEVYNQTAREVCEGQQYDMNFEQLAVVPINDYLEMIRLKTAVLLGCCLKTGGLAAGAGTQDANDLYRFGEQLGIAFQIQDDYLDSFGDEQSFGKKTGGDILAGKKTYLYLKALQVASKVQQELLRSIYENTTLDDAIKIASIRQIFQDLSVPRLAENEIEAYYRKAQAALAKVSLPEEKKEGLNQYCRQLMNRNF